MKPLTPLFTSGFLVDAPDWPASATPVVRYSDHCAALAQTEHLRVNAVARCERLLRELERMTVLCERQRAELEYQRDKPLDADIGRAVGRWAIRKTTDRQPAH